MFIFENNALPLKYIILSFLYCIKQSLFFTPQIKPFTEFERFTP